jgi:type VI protein secretion system component Hcp
MQVILLNYPGIKGEVTIAGYANLVACQSLSMSTVGAESTTGTAGLGDETPQREGPNVPSTPPSASQRRLGIDNLSLTKTVDQATPKLFEAAFKKKSTSITATILVFRAYEQDAQALQSDLSAITSSNAATLNVSGSPIFWHKQFLTITLTDVNISSHEISVSESELTETIKISFKTIQMDYTMYANGMKMGIVQGTVDLTQTN